MEGKFYKCDGPGCESAAPAEGMGTLPKGWYELTFSDKLYATWHFHSRLCLLNFVQGVEDADTLHVVRASGE